MGNTASAITCYPLKTEVMQGRLAVKGVMVVSYFLCRATLSVKNFFLAHLCSLASVCGCALK